MFQAKRKSQAADDQTAQHPGIASPGVRVTPEGQSADEQTEPSDSQTKQHAIKPEKNPAPKNELLTLTVRICAAEDNEKRATALSEPPGTPDRHRKMTTQAVVHGDSLAVTEEDPDRLPLPPAAPDGRSSSSRGCLLDSTCTPLETCRELGPESAVQRDRSVLLSHSTSCLGHASCSDGDKQDLWKRAFLLISTERRTVRRMNYLRSHAPEMAARVGRERKRTDVAVVASLPSCLKKTTGKNSQQGALKRAGDTSDNVPASTRSNATQAARPVTTSSRSMRNRKDNFNELCGKYSRHAGEAVHLALSGEKENGCSLPPIDTNLSAPPASSASAYVSSAVIRTSGEVPGSPSGRRSKETERAKHSRGSTGPTAGPPNGEGVPCADSSGKSGGTPYPLGAGPRQAVDLHKARGRTRPRYAAVSPRRNTRRPLSLPHKSSRDPKQRRRLVRSFDSVAELQTTGRMKDRILDIKRIYGSAWIRKWREQVRRRAAEVLREIQNDESV